MIDFNVSFAKLPGIELDQKQARYSRDNFEVFLGQEQKGLWFMIEESGILALCQGL